MNAPALITAAVVAIGAASIATSARANPVCEIKAAIAYSAEELRQSGTPQREAAAVMAGVIGNMLSDQAGGIHIRQDLASAMGGFAQDALQWVYSYPIMPSRAERAFEPQLSAEYVYVGCLEGRF